VGPTFKIQIFRKQRLAYSGELGGAVEMGRQQRADEPLFVEQLAPGGRRIAIARLEESTISRAHLRLEALSADRFRATNLSTHNVVACDDGPTLSPAKSGEFRMPALLTIADAAIRIEPAIEAEPEFEMLARPTILPSGGSSQGTAARGIFRVDGAAPGPAIPSLLGEPAAAPRSILALAGQAPESIVAWLQTVIDVLQSAASSPDFFDRAAAAVVQLVGLDSGCVLTVEGEQWRTRSQFFGPRLRPAAGEVRPSARILARMKQERRTFWHAPSAAGPLPDSHSLVDVQAVVVAPILDPRGEVIGALYGDRRKSSAANLAPSISKPEAMIVETLACGVAAGLARLDQEQKALAARVQFEQFFTPELANQLTVEPDLLKGRDVEVTILFSDIRGFSRIADRLGPASTLEWISAVMGALSDCVIKHGGVLVDYIGDELMAMWGAPLAQPDHAERACRAALEMWQALPELNTHWSPKVGERFSLGVGVNTGVARVGNTGTHRKFKYGPLGSTVNVASRVQGATRYLRSGMIVTAATKQRLGAEFPTRRLCKVRVVNIAEPIELFELRAEPDRDWQAVCKKYEQGLKQFEARDFQGAAATLGQLLADNPDDAPALILLSRAVNQLVDSDVEFSEAWELPGK
jgi:adenylate cyclase